MLIAGERRGQSVEEVLLYIQSVHGEGDVALSSISAIELTHGIYRASSEMGRTRRSTFVRQALQDIVVYPLTLEIAQLAGRIEGEQAALGFAIPFQDLAIGATALYLGFAVATLNVRHFRMIPGLNVVTS